MNLQIGGSITSVQAAGIALLSYDTQGAYNYISVRHGGAINGKIGISATGFTHIMNDGTIKGQTAVQLSVNASVQKPILINSGLIEGADFAIQGSNAGDYVSNTVSGEIAGTINLGHGNDYFSTAGVENQVYLGGGDDYAIVVWDRFHLAGHTFRGEEGNDTLAGGPRDDTMWGGAGYDVFLFRPNNDASQDYLRDFNPAEDIIQLDRTKFTALALGDLQNFALSESRLLGPGIVRNRVNGDISYDKDGAGGEPPVVFAWVNPNINMTRFDFEVV